MPKSPGWFMRETLNFPHQTSTTGTLIVNKPTATLDNDIMLMHLTHKGVGYATVPAGWTLITQNVIGVLRGEMYWKRAASEPASYTVTGVDVSAAGFIMSYAGGKLTGNPIEAAVSTATVGTPGQAFTDRFLTNGVTTTSPRALIICACSRQSGPNDGYRFSKTFFPINNPSDYDIYLVIPIKSNSGASGARFGFGHIIKTVPGPTDMLLNLDYYSTDRIGFTIALTPETGITAGTRYYLGCKPPSKFLLGTTKVHWDSTVDSPRNYTDQVPDHDFIFELTPYKTDAGPVYAYQSTSLSLEDSTRGGGNTNIQGENVLYHRWTTPILETQGVGGTLTLMMVALCQYAQGCQLGSPSSITGTWRIHAYVTVGDSLDVRSVLLDNYIGSAAWVQGGGVFTKLTVPLVTRSVQLGDRIVIEIGTHILTSSITPGCTTLPASNYAQIWLTRGASSIRNPSQSGPGVPDGVEGSYIIIGAESDVRGCPYIEFSSNIVEAVEATPIPPNISVETAEIITTLPYTAPEINTRRVPNPTRLVYYKWIPDRSGKVYAVTWKSCCYTWIKAEGPGVDNNETYAADQGAGALSRSTLFFNTIAGQEIIFSIRTTLDIYGWYYNAPSAGGVLNFGLYWHEPPEDGDVIAGISKFLVRFRGDVLVGMGRFGSGTALSGLAIDYTKRSMVMYDTDMPNSEVDRLYVGFFQGYGANGTVGIYNLDNLELVDFISDGTDVLDGSALSSIALSATGQMYVGWFGDGFQRIANGAASYMDKVSSVNEARINSMDGIRGDYQPGYPWPDANYFPTEYEAGGTNYIELNPEGTTIYYTSGGWYTPTGGQKIKRMDAATGAQLPDFATVVSTGPNPGLKGLFPMPNDLGVLVCAGSRIARLNKNGVEIQSYTVPNAARGSSFTDVELCSDAKHFWALDEMSNTFYKINLKTGAIVLENWVPIGLGSTTSLVVYRKDPYPPPWKELSGIYFINPANTHDIYNTDERKIPDPTVKTALIGE